MRAYLGSAACDGMAQASSGRRRWRHSDDPVSHHRVVPIEPFSAFDPYGGSVPPDGLAGHLLVAAPGLADPNFFRRVVLVVDHGDHGALGVVLDRPGGVPVRELMPQWEEWATAPAELFTGGPVARNALIGLVRLSSRDAAVEDSDRRPDGWRLLIDGDRPVGTVDLGSDPQSAAEAIVGVRLFSGYAGWDSQQLEAEIDEGSWYVVRAEAPDPISADPEGLWRRVLRRQGGALEVVSGFPEDPALN
jgi:putative transcriptional regulator